MAEEEGGREGRRGRRVCCLERTFLSTCGEKR